MNKQVILIILVSATLGLIAGRPTVLPSDSRRSEPVRPALKSEAGPVETPLVEKLLQPAKVQPPNPTIADGQLSPRGEWRWSQAQGAWVPVPQPGPKWLQDGHSATVDHLVRDHGMSYESVRKLTPAQRDTIHSSLHNARNVNGVRTVYPPVLNQSSGCPGGVCPSPSRSRGLFRRR